MKRKVTPKVQTIMENPNNQSFHIVLSSVPDQDFEAILLAAIDDAFSTLGEPAKKAIYPKLEETFKIKKQEIPFRIDDFQNALEKIFGVGCRHLEILFIKNLHKKLKATKKWDTLHLLVPDITFQEYLRRAKATFGDSGFQNRE